MPVVQRSIVVNAPEETVFAIHDNPKRAPEHFAGVIRVTDIVQTPKRVGDTARFTYTALGLRFPTKTTVLDWEKNKRIVFRMEGGVGGTFTITDEPQGNGTKVTYRFDYEMKAGILGKALDKLLVYRMNEKNAGRSLENLKMLCEADAKKK